MASTPFCARVAYGSAFTVLRRDKSAFTGFRCDKSVFSVVRHDQSGLAFMLMEFYEGQPNGVTTCWSTGQRPGFCAGNSGSNPRGIIPDRVCGASARRGEPPYSADRIRCGAAWN